MDNRVYIAIDLKSFYASVECADRGLDPLNTNLVVADASRTDKTICLAVSPSLKAYGIPGRARLFEVKQKVKEANNIRRNRINGAQFQKKSVFDNELKAHPDYELDFITAVPRMQHYIKCSTRIYDVYLRYVAPEDMHIYSVDEVFIDATQYLKTYKLTARELAMEMIKAVLKETGITATAGIGTNMYLCKIAMDIVAKHMPADENGVRIAQLDEMSYRQQLWDHKPLTDFWRVGRGYASKLKSYGINTMGDVARCSLENEDFLYKLFGVNAELLIDHAWGYEPCTIEEVKRYRPENNSFSSGQVLLHPYPFDQARTVVCEMAESVALDLVAKDMVTDQMVLTVGYDIECLNNPDIKYEGEVTIDHYGRRVPKHAHGTANLNCYTSSTKIITDAVMKLYDRVVNSELLIRRLNITTNHVIFRKDMKQPEQQFEQLDLFTDYDEKKKQEEKNNIDLTKERRMQEAMLAIKNKYGKNAILKGVNFREGATGRDRNEQIGGHRS
ncbi:MAG: DNA methylase [Lachnospiraceae bacterium]|nr:DNA methylase [Lachnospiraceae bacterium]